MRKNLQTTELEGSVKYPGSILEYVGLRESVLKIGSHKHMM